MTPSGWRRTRLPELSSLEMGETIIGKDLSGDGIPVFSAGRDPRPWGYTSKSRKAFQRGTIILGARGTIGFPRLPPFEKYVSTQTTIAVKPGEGVEPQFLAHALTRVDYDTITAKQAVPMLTITALRDVEVLVPPLPEQRRIAAILSSVDQVIEKTAAIIDQIQAAKRTMMKELLTRGMPGRRRCLKPLAEEWRLGRVAEGIRQIPEDWRLVTLSSVARLESGHTPSRRHPEFWNGGVPWVSLHDSKSLDVPEIDDTSQKIAERGLENSSARLLPAGTVVFSRTATIGKCSVIGKCMATSQDFANYVCGDHLFNRYLMHLFRSMGKEWDRLMAGSTHQTIYMPVFEQLQILLPPFEEQVEIARLGDAFDERIVSERRVVEGLRELKQGLAAALLTGAVRVPPGEHEVAA